MKHPAKVRFVGNREDYKHVKGEGQAIIFDQTVHFEEDGNALEEGPIACHEITDSDPNDFLFHCWEAISGLFFRILARRAYKPSRQKRSR